MRDIDLYANGIGYERVVAKIAIASVLLIKFHYIAYTHLNRFKYDHMKIY